MDPDPRPLRILHLTAGSDAGGLSRYLVDLCNACRDAGHVVTVAGERGAWHETFERAALHWIEVPMKGGPLALGQTVRTLRAWLARNPIDVIHTHYRRATLVGRWLQQANVPPILYTVHLSDLSLAGPRRWLTDFGDHTHVPAEEARDWVIEAGRVPPDRVTLIPHGVNPQRFSFADDAAKAAAKAAMGFPSGARIAAYVGRFDAPKNEDWILDLADASRERLPEVQFVLLGEGPHEAELRRRVDVARLHDRVKLLPRQDPLRLYEAADALLLPSAREGFSLVCAEGMSVGVPVLRTRTAGTAQLIREGVTGRSVPVDRQTFLASAMAFLVDRDALQAMGRNAAKHVRANLTFGRQLNQTLELYARLVHRRRNT